MNVDKLINKPQNTYKLNRLIKLINENDLDVKTPELSNELFEKIEILENCTTCKDKKIDGNCLDGLEKEEINELNSELLEINIRLNKEILCEGCKRKKIEKLTDKCGNEEIARFLYQCKLNMKHYNSFYIRWIPFDEFKNIEYLAKGGFGEVHKSTWTKYNDRFEERYKNKDVVLKRIYNNSSDDKIVDILKEVK